MTVQSAMGVCARALSTSVSQMFWRESQWQVVAVSMPGAAENTSREAGRGGVRKPRKKGGIQRTSGGKQRVPQNRIGNSHGESGC